MAQPRLLAGPALTRAETFAEHVARLGPAAHLRPEHRSTSSPGPACSAAVAPRFPLRASWPASRVAPTATRVCWSTRAEGEPLSGKDRMLLASGRSSSSTARCLPPAGCRRERDRLLRRCRFADAHLRCAARSRSAAAAGPCSPRPAPPMHTLRGRSRQPSTSSTRATRGRPSRRRDRSSAASTAARRSCRTSRRCATSPSSRAYGATGTARWAVARHAARRSSPSTARRTAACARSSSERALGEVARAAVCAAEQRRRGSPGRLLRPLGRHADSGWRCRSTRSPARRRRVLRQWRDQLPAGRGVRRRGDCGDHGVHGRPERRAMRAMRLRAARHCRHVQLASPEPRHAGDVERLERWASQITGRGACAHPTGAVGLLASALDRLRARHFDTTLGAAAASPARRARTAA